jgi:superfamily II DNA or RNA helicase
MKGDCLSRGKKPLQSHQTKFVKAFIGSKKHGAIAIHGAGSGKTLLAVTATKCYHGMYPSNKIIVITPASLLSGFKKELSQYELSRNNEYSYYTYAGYAQKPMNCTDALLIIDEVQNLKSPDGVLFQKILGCSKQAHKVLLLSATPIVNSGADMATVMALIDGSDPLAPDMLEKIMNHPKLVESYFGCKLSFFENDPARSAKFFPKVSEHYVPIPMDSKTYKTYMHLENNAGTSDIASIFDLDDPEEKDLQSFFNGLRRISSSSQQKLDYMFEFMNSIFHRRPNKRLGITQGIIDGHTDKFIIFTHFKEHGSNLITKQLKKEGIPFGFIDGTVTKAKRTEVVDKYVAGTIKVILISAAGATGLNLLETGFMFLVEPSWNNSEIIQVMARANRYLSHANLPKKMRNVMVMKILLIKPEERKHIAKLITDKTQYATLAHNPSIDVKMLVDANRKQLQITKHLKMLENKVSSLEMCAKKPSVIPSDLSYFRVLTKSISTSVPQLTANETRIVNHKDMGPTPSHTSIRSIAPTLVQEMSNTNNASLVKNIMSMVGVTKIKHPMVILFDVLTPVLPFNFLNNNSDIYADIFSPRLTTLAKKHLGQLPRTRFTTSTNVKKYKIAILNYYINFQTGIPLSQVSIVKMITWLINVRSTVNITFLMIGGNVFNSFKFQKFLRNKTYNSVEYTSMFHKIEHTGDKSSVEMYLLKFA